MKSENVIRSPLLLFNFYLLTQYILLFFCLKTKRFCFYFLTFNYYLLPFNSIRIDIKKGNLPRLPIFINLKSNTMKNTMQR